MSRAGTLLSLAAVAAAGLAYLPALPGEWVYDDVRFVAANASVEEGAPWFRYFTDPATQVADDSSQGLYRPLRTLSYRAVRLLGPGPGPQRVAGILLHALNGLLLLGLLRRPPFRAGAGAALAGGLWFMLHPLACEAVGWVSSRGDLLAVTGMLAATHLHLGSGASRRIGALACFGAALLAKESAIALPLLLAVVDLLRGNLRSRLAGYLPYVAVGAVWAAARYAALGGGGFGQEGGAGLPPIALAGGLLAAPLYYAAALTAPWWLSFELRIEATPLTASTGFLVCCGVAAAVAALARRRSPVAAGVAIAAAALVPVTVLQVVFPMKILVANRFAYPALLGGAVVVGAVAGRSRAALGLCLAVSAAFLPLTVQRAMTWSGPARLWADVLRGDPGNPVALFGLGAVRLEQGDFREARELLGRARAAEPLYPKLAAFHGEACLLLAGEEPAGSEESKALLREALGGYHTAVRLWRNGERTDRHLHRTMLLDAAWVALRAGREDLAREHAFHFLRRTEPVLPHRRSLRELRELAAWLASRGEDRAAEALFDAARDLEGR